MTNNKLYIKSRRPINMNENFKEELERLAEEHMLDMVDDDLEDIQNKDDLINMI